MLLTLDYKEYIGFLEFKFNRRPVLLYSIKPTVAQNNVPVYLFIQAYKWKRFISRTSSYKLHITYKEFILNISSNKNSLIRYTDVMIEMYMLRA